MAFTFQRAYPPMQPPPGPALWFPFHKDKLLVQQQGDSIQLLQGEASLFGDQHPEHVLFLGTLDGLPCLTFAVSAEYAQNSGWQEVGVRNLFGKVEDGPYVLAGYAFQILNWQYSSRFCPACGSPTEMIAKTWGRQCTQCPFNSFPPVTPAVLVLVHDGDKVLLAHKPGWGKLYGLIAGFVEPGESLEECVIREVQEEASLEVTDVVYMDSQSWPFPHQMMVGFSARYVSGTPTPEEDELDEVKWFTRETLPTLPSPSSLSYVMIARWLKL